MFFSCQKDNEPVKLSRKSLEGTWVLTKETQLFFNSDGSVDSLTPRYVNELTINETDTCSILDYYTGWTFKYKVDFTEPDTLWITTCPIGVICEPFDFNIPFKIIDFSYRDHFTGINTQTNTSDKVYYEYKK